MRVLETQQKLKFVASMMRSVFNRVKLFKILIKSEREAVRRIDQVIEVFKKRQCLFEIKKVSDRGMAIGTIGRALQKIGIRHCFEVLAKNFRIYMKLVKDLEQRKLRQ